MSKIDKPLIEMTPREKEMRRREEVDRIMKSPRPESTEKIRSLRPLTVRQPASFRNFEKKKREARRAQKDRNSNNESLIDEGDLF